jgi:hypothetical protein
MGKILGGFSAGLSLFTRSGAFFDRKPAKGPELKTRISWKCVSSVKNIFKGSIYNMLAEMWAYHHRRLH